MSWPLREDRVSGVTRPSEHRARGRESGRVRPGALRGPTRRPARGGKGVGRWRSAGLVEGERQEGVTSFSQNLELDGEGARTDLRK